LSKKRYIPLFILLICTGACAGKNINRELRTDPHILQREWTIPTHGVFEAGDKGFEFSNPILVDNTLIFGNQSVGLVSIYPGSVQTRWVLPIPQGVISGLTHEAGNVYFGGGDGFLYSVNSENGRVNWRYDLHNPLISSPAISEGRLFVTTTDDTVYAFDAGTGKWLWHYRRRTSPTATILGASTPLVDGNEVIAGLSDGFIVGLDINDGQLKWEKKLHQGTKFTDVDAHPVLDDGIIYIPSYDGALYALKRRNAEVVWRFDAGGSKKVVIEEDTVFFPSSEGIIYALQKNNAKVRWKFEMDGGTPTKLVIAGKYLVVASSYQYLYVIDKTSGKGVYRYNVGYGSGFYGSPVVDHHSMKLYFLSSAGNLFSFYIRPPDRKSRPHVPTDPFVFSRL